MARHYTSGRILFQSDDGEIRYRVDCVEGAYYVYDRDHFLGAPTDWETALDLIDAAMEEGQS